jgi:hypothetical protein
MLLVNLGVADATQASISIFVGFLVLSQIPQTREELVTAIDVHSAALRGMGQAMAIGLDDVVHAVSQPGFDWSVETESVERLAAVSLSWFPGAELDSIAISYRSSTCLVSLQFLWNAGC